MKASDIEVLSALQVSEKGNKHVKKDKHKKEDIKCNEGSKKKIFQYYLQQDLHFHGLKCITYIHIFNIINH